MGYAPLVLVGALLLSSACAGQRITIAPAGPTATPSSEPAAPRTSPSAPTAAAPLTVGYEEKGEASWYGNPYHGRRAASGEIYDMNQMTAAHRTLPFDTRVWVVSLVDGTGVEVRINDRGPFKDPERRIIDVSYAAARLLGVVGPGVIPVRIRVVWLPGGARSAPPSAPAASSAPATPSPPAPPRAALPVPVASSSGSAATSAVQSATPAVPAPAAAPAPASSPGSSPPVSPPATPVASARELPTGESPAPRETAAAPRVAVATSREGAALPRETAASREIPAELREGWTLQFAAYSTEARAMAQREDLARGWPGAHVQKGDVGGRTVWRVRVGRYPTRREAEEAAQRMAAAGHRVIVVEDPAR